MAFNDLTQATIATTTCQCLIRPQFSRLNTATILFVCLFLIRPRQLLRRCDLLIFCITLLQNSSHFILNSLLLYQRCSYEVLRRAITLFRVLKKRFSALLILLKDLHEIVPPYYKSLPIIWSTFHTNGQLSHTTYIFMTNKIPWPRPRQHNINCLPNLRPQSLALFHCQSSGGKCATSTSAWRILQSAVFSITLILIGSFLGLSAGIGCRTIIFDLLAIISYYIQYHPSPINLKLSSLDNKHKLWLLPLLKYNLILMIPLQI